MGLYERWILPHVIDAACGMPPVRAQRAKIVAEARGIVLEPGIGSGLNLPLYDPEAVTKVIGVDPSVELGNKARRLAQGFPFEVELHSLGGEVDVVPAASVDTVVLTYTLCTVPDPAALLAAALRALKPGGQLLFCEHALAPELGVSKWQRRIEPVWKALAGGCHLTRSAAASIVSAGFELARLDQFYAEQAPRFVGFHQLGVARARVAAS